MDRSAITLGGVLAVTGFLLTTAVLTGRVERAKQEPRRAELIALIEERDSHLDDLETAVERLRADVAREQQRAARAGDAAQATADRLDRLSRSAGTVALRGPGVVVRLAPSDRPPPAPEDAGAYRIHDTDIQLVVNALLAAGAEAVSINGSRLVATTPIRAAGDTIVVNFRPLSPPFDITAIGPDRRRFLASDIARRFERWKGLFGLGFSVEEKRDVTVPAYTGRVSIVTATPVGAS